MFSRKTRPEWQAGRDVICGRWSRYSTILHEVLVGLKEEFRVFAARLHGHLLLPELSDAHALLAEHKRLLALGRDVEREPPEFEAIAVQGPADRDPDIS